VIGRREGVGTVRDARLLGHRGLTYGRVPSDSQMDEASLLCEHLRDMEQACDQADTRAAFLSVNPVPARCGAPQKGPSRNSFETP
jgi:hypothetical protein